MQYPSILVIGAGNMGKPVIRALLETGAVQPQNLMVITGDSEGSDEVGLHAFITSDSTLPLAVRSSATTSAIHTNRITCISRSDAKAITNIAPQDVVIYAAKPQQLQQALLPLVHVFKPNALLISIAGGVKLSAYEALLKTMGVHANVVRTMPHIPRSLIGLYGADGALCEKVANLLRGMGEALILKAESQMHAFTAHAGCGPAFVAQFMQRLMAEQGRDATDTAKALKACMLPEIPLLPSGGRSTGTVQFYQAWLKLALEDFAPTQAKQIVDNTISGTLDYLAQHPQLSLQELATLVRSPKGTTNAGLIAMGSPPPDDERFGNAAERSEQAQWADRFLSKFTCSESIGYALKAALVRSRAMENPQLAKHPLGGVDFEGMLK